MTNEEPPAQSTNLQSNKKVSLFKFILTDSRFSSKDRLEYFGFLGFMVVLIPSILYLLVNAYNHGSIPHLGLLGVLIIFIGIDGVLKCVLRINRKFIQPYNEYVGKNEIAAIREEVLMTTFKTSQKSTNTYKKNIAVFYAFLLLFIVVVLFVPPQLLNTSITILFIGSIILLIWTIITWIKSWKDSSKDADKLYDELEKKHPAYKEEIKTGKKIGNIIVLFVIVLFVAGFIYIWNTPNEKNCLFLNMFSNAFSRHTEIGKANDLNHCFLRYAEKSAESNYSKSLEFCEKIKDTASYTKDTCIGEVALFFAKEDMEQAYSVCKNRCVDYVFHQLKNIEDEIKLCDIRYREEGQYSCYYAIYTKHVNEATYTRVLDSCNQIINESDKTGCIELLDVARKVRTSR